MLLGRLMGWLLVAVTVIMASADAVLALGPVEYAGIITADVLTLLAGHTPETALPARSILDVAQSVVLDLPAWIVLGLMGFSLIVGCRKRPRRRSFRR